MGKVLVLTEKPSVAKDIAFALSDGKAVKKNGYYMYENYVITYALGHLFTIDDNKYSEKWELEKLPIFPEKFEYKIIDKVKGQVDIIRNLLRDTDLVINACDSGREGELIARLILINLSYKGEVKRLWTSEALTKEVVKREFSKNLKDGKNYDSLFYSALARQHADWITGINLTRLITLKANDKTVWSIGRVQTPVLRIIVERYLENKNFVPEIYYILKGEFRNNNGVVYTGVLKERFSKEESDRILLELEKKFEAVIEEFNNIEKKQSPPLLHSLTSLQRESNTLFGLTAEKTLNIAQKLYEVYKCISYPRTDSNYLPESSKPLVASVLKKIEKAELIKKINSVGKRVFNDEKLTDHHAIIVLNKLPENATDFERKVYNLIYRRFVGAFMEPYVYGEVQIETKVDNYTFHSSFKYDVMKEDEFKSCFLSLYKDEVKRDDFVGKEILKLKKGDVVNITKIEKEQKQTSPPDLYTEATLLKEMERLKLGTPATRAAVIETLKNREYIFLKGRSLIPSNKGIEIIEKVKDSLISRPEMTSQWENKLEEIYTKGKAKDGYREFIDEIKSFIAKEIEILKQKDIESRRDIVGKCVCGGDITKYKKVYKCINCGTFVYNTIFGKKLSDKQAVNLINRKKVKLIGLKNKNGKKFNAIAILKEQGKVELSFNF